MKQREKLLKMVFEDGMTTYKSCKHLDINYSTGKSIIKSFKKKGTVIERKEEILRPVDQLLSQREETNIRK